MSAPTIDGLVFLKTVGDENHVYVAPHNGNFAVRFKGHDDLTQYDTFEKANVAIERADKKSRKPLAVPIGKFDSYKGIVKRGVITGRHSGNHNWLVSWTDGTKEQYGDWELQNSLRDLTSDEVTVLTGLYRAKESAIKAFEAKLKELKFDKEAIE